MRSLFLTVFVALTREALYATRRAQPLRSSKDTAAGPSATEMSLFRINSCCFEQVNSALQPGISMTHLCPQVIAPFEESIGKRRSQKRTHRWPERGHVDQIFQDPELDRI